MNIDAYPLCWPHGWPRTNSRERGSFIGTQGRVQTELLQEIDRLVLGSQSRGYTVGHNVIISTNIPVKLDGRPYANSREPADSGVAVYFERKGKRQCFACDKYDKVWKNMRAIQKTIESLRGIERWGSSDMLDRAFTGFAALPAPGVRNWWEVLGVEQSADHGTIKARFRELARTQHPDNGGSHEMMAEINAAYQEASKGMTS